MPHLDNQSLAQLIAQLADANNDVARKAGDALVAARSSVVPGLLAAVAPAAIPVRRRLMFLLGEIGRREAATAHDMLPILSAHLDDADWKVRRNAAIALGKLQHRPTLPALKQRLTIETDTQVRTSLILSLGQVAQPSDQDVLADVLLTTEAEKIAAQKVADRLVAQSQAIPAIDTESMLSPAIKSELWCRKGVAALVQQECAAHGMPTQVIAPDRIRLAQTLSFGQMLTIRTALFPVLVVELPNDPSSPALLGAQFAATHVASEMRRLTQSEAVSYRMTFDNAALSQQTRSQWIAEFASATHGLINRASGYSWEIMVRSTPKALVFAARPASVVDQRFAYRKSMLPAALHPTLAAAAVQLVPGHADDIVVDPFCGSGTLLAERAMYAPYKRLIGFDHHLDAIQAARINLEGLPNVSLHKTSFKALAKRQNVSLIITNPPYGQRVANRKHARVLHNELDSLAAMVLRPGGTLIVFRPPNFPDPEQLTVIERRRIDAGGLHVDLIVAQKST
ncbi:MAG: methyltransferase [Chloroflexaceae bacterium]|nr:methyltransferase [Chloroflexaceae bacterium]